MLPRSRLNKNRRRLIHHSKGFSSIIGAVFAALIMISLISALFVWSLSQNTLYNNSVRQSNQTDLDRSNEKVMTDVNVSRINDSSVWVNGTLENYGSLSVQIITLWVADANNGNYTYTPLNIALPPGARSSIAVNVPLVNSVGDGLGCWFISARGNTLFEKSFSPTYVYNVDNRTTGESVNWSTSALIASGIGAFAFDFTSFKYYNVSAGKLNLPGAQTCTVPWDGSIAFSFKITNLFPTGQNITLDSRCEMWSYFPSAPGQATGPLWWLANVNTATGSISPSYTPIILYWNKTTEVFFAIQSRDPTWKSLQANQLGAINLLMYGVFTGPPRDGGPATLEYAQNIPFISILAKAP